jgi:hypothetical protein
MIRLEKISVWKQSTPKIATDMLSLLASLFLFYSQKEHSEKGFLKYLFGNGQYQK